jgi:endonuclease III
MMKHEENFKLLQEILWPNRWQSTVACVLLNRTKRAQVDKVWPSLFQEAPDAKSLLLIDDTRLKEILKPLGLSKVRSSRLKKLAKGWIDFSIDNGEPGREDFSKLCGVGEYAIASDKIFYRNELPEDVKDHALSYYLKKRKIEHNKF